MKVIFFVIECMDKEYLDKCHTPNLDTLEVHPAKSWGRMTRSSVPLLLGGFLPTCQVKNCDHNKIQLQDPFFLSELKRRGWLWLYISNGWTLELLNSYILPELRSNIIKWHHSHDTLEMVNDFLHRENTLNHYFTYFHVMETHPPFYYPPYRLPHNLIEDEKSKNYHRRKSVEYVDEILGKVLKINTDLTVVTSDHNLAQGEWNVKDFDVFIATKGKVITEVMWRHE